MGMGVGGQPKSMQILRGVHIVAGQRRGQSATGIFRRSGGAVKNTSASVGLIFKQAGRRGLHAHQIVAPNKAGAMVVINAIISGEIQLTQYAQLRELPVVATEKLSADEKTAFDAVDLGKGVLSQAELLAHRLPEMPASLVPVIEDIWLNEVVGK